MALLAVQSLNYFVGKKQLLKSISCAANANTITALLGPNGAGKTTLLKCIMGLNQSPAVVSHTNENAIAFDGHGINTFSVSKRVELGLVYLPQHTSLLQGMTVQENLEIVYQYHAFWKDQPHDQFTTEADHWLTIINLNHAKKQKAGSLSGGQKRKLEVIRSLLMKPKMVLLDEPFAGVDPKSIYELKQIFQNLAQAGISIIISDHNVDQLLSIAQNVYVIIAGQAVTSGTIKDILENNYTKESYLGKEFYQEIAQRYL